MVQKSLVVGFVLRGELPDHRLKFAQVALGWLLVEGLKCEQKDPACFLTGLVHELTTRE